VVAYNRDPGLFHLLTGIPSNSEACHVGSDEVACRVIHCYLASRRILSGGGEKLSANTISGRRRWRHKVGLYRDGVLDGVG